MISIIHLLEMSIGTSGTILIFWPASSTGYILQVNAVCTGGSWQPVTDPITVVNGQNQVTVTTTVGNGFYRLFHP